MNAEPEIYPPDALADEEPRYLRRQKPLEVRRRKFNRRSWPAYRRWLLVGAGVLVTGVVAFEGARFFLFSPRTQLASYEEIEIKGNHYVNAEVIAEKFSADLGKSVLRVPLAARRADLEAVPWIETASVQRALPNRLRVEITERVPVAFLRSGGQLALVDAAGVILDRPLEGDFSLPIVTGFGEAMPLADRARRMSLFVEFLKDIDLAHPGASDQVSEVDLSDAQDVSAALTGLPGMDEPTPVVVHFGDSDFVNRYRLLVENIGPWRSSAGRVESVDLRFARQVVVNPGSSAERAAPSGAPAAKKH